MRTKAVTDVSSAWSLFGNDSTFSDFNRDNPNEVLSKLGGYQYFAGDVVARTIAAQRLRLYARVPDNGSKFCNRKEQIYVKNIPVSRNRLEYLKGNKEISHSGIMYKALAATDGIVEVLEHPALDIIRDINPYSNQWEFFYTLALSMQFYGNSYFQKVRDGSGNVSELWLAPAQNMIIVQGDTLDNFIDHYKWGEALGKTIIFDPNDILDFMIPGVGNSQVYGTSKIEITWDYINMMESSLAFQKAICDNVGRPDFILSAEASKTSSDDIKRIERKWNDKHFGPSQAGKMAYTPGKIKIDVLPRTEFNFDTDEALIRAISTGFSVPEHLILKSSPISANASQQDRDYKEYTIDSYLSMIEEVLNEDFLSEFGMEGREQDLFFAFDPIIKEDEEFLQKTNVENYNSGITNLNEARGNIGLDPVEGGDEFKTETDNNNDTTDTSSPAKNIIDNDMKDKIDDIMEKMSENKLTPTPPPPIVINVIDTEIEEVIEDDGETSQEGVSEDSQNIDESQKGLEDEVVEVIDEESLSDKIANKFKEI